MTLGEKLKKIRSEYRISLNEVSKHTKIQMKYLEYLENGEYEKLPAEVYVRGFVRSYAGFLGTDETALVKLYERERNIQKNLKKEQFQEQKERTFDFPRFIITPKLLIGSLVIVFVSTGFVYLYREFQSFASVPRLTIASPLDGQTVSGSEVTVHGTTEKDVTLTINKQMVLVRENGDFSEDVRLQPGLNIFTVAATNSFKKEKVVTFSVQADYSAPVISQEVGASAVTDLAPAKTSFEISVQDRPLTVNVMADGALVYNGVMNPGEKHAFSVVKDLSVSSEDASKTFVRKGNADLATPLGTVPGEVKNIVFASENSGSGAE